MSYWDRLPSDLQRRIRASARYMHLNDLAYLHRDAVRRTAGAGFRNRIYHRRVRAYLGRHSFRSASRHRIVADMLREGVPIRQIYLWTLRHPI